MPRTIWGVVKEGVVQPETPLPEGARVQIVVFEESGNAAAVSPEEWRRRILETAGTWQGDFERPEP
jgi:hypothetical protein